MKKKQQLLFNQSLKKLQSKISKIDKIGKISRFGKSLLFSSVKETSSKEIQRIPICILNVLNTNIITLHIFYCFFKK